MNREGLHRDLGIRDKGVGLGRKVEEHRTLLGGIWKIQPHHL